LRRESWRSASIGSTRDVLCLDLPILVGVKGGAGRWRDLEALAELDAIADGASLTERWTPGLANQTGL